MLVYLDNDQNTKESPNENLARELFELFTLGEGHYTEGDVHEAARALTGWDVRFPEGAVFMRGRTRSRARRRCSGRARELDVDGLVGSDPGAATTARAGSRGASCTTSRAASRTPSASSATPSSCATPTTSSSPSCGRLFLDPDFYAADVVGTRISGPVEYLVGASRRLGLEPPPRLVWIAAGQLGQRLFEPPSVKGWEGGRAWIGTSSFLQRGNAVGLFLGVVSVDQVLAREPGLDGAMMAQSMEGDGDGAGDGAWTAGRAEDETGADDSMDIQKRMQERELGGMRKVLDGKHYWPDINLTARCQEAGARTDREIAALLCDELLAVEASDASREALEDFLAAERVELRRSNGALLKAGPESEHALRRLAHLVLSLPEAQLH